MVKDLCFVEQLQVNFLMNLTQIFKECLLIIESLDGAKILEKSIEIDRMMQVKAIFVSCLYDYISTHFSIHLTIFNDDDCE